INTDKKIFEYNSIIISLYGMLERYVERFVKEYLELLSSVVPNYEKLDEKLKEKHFELSIKLIGSITSREHAKYQHLTKESVLQQLHGCIENIAHYKINTDAFVLLSGNLKHPKIVELFTPINLNVNAALQKNEPFVAFLKEIHEGKSISNLKPDTLYFKINDLVDRRNEIAHGSSRSDNILSINELRSYIIFLEKYIRALFKVLQEKYIQQESIHQFEKIKVIKGVWNQEILGFEIENATIVIGDRIIVHTAEDNFMDKKILDIQIDNISYSKIEITTKTNVAIKIAPILKLNQSFFIKK
ncbi:MAG: hypothetical protein RL329_2598, partial [Bacteroidota bacterium]